MASRICSITSLGLACHARKRRKLFVESADRVRMAVPFARCQVTSSNTGAILLSGQPLRIATPLCNIHLGEFFAPALQQDNCNASSHLLTSRWTSLFHISARRNLNWTGSTPGKRRSNGPFNGRQHFSVRAKEDFWNRVLVGTPPTECRNLSTRSIGYWVRLLCDFRMGVACASYGFRSPLPWPNRWPTKMQTVHLVGMRSDVTGSRQ